jgi:putative transposase
MASTSRRSGPSDLRTKLDIEKENTAMFAIWNRPNVKNSMKERSAEEIVAKLRQAESFMAQGLTGIEVVQALGLMEAFYQDRQSQGAAQQAEGAARIEELQTENARLRKTVADLVLDKRILQELANGNW